MGYRNSTPKAHGGYENAARLLNKNSGEIEWLNYMEICLKLENLVIGGH